MFVSVEIKGVVWVEESDETKAVDRFKSDLESAFRGASLHADCSAPATHRDFRWAEMKCCHCGGRKGLTLLDALDMPREDFEPVCQPCLDEDAESAAEEDSDG